VALSSTYRHHLCSGDGSSLAAAATKAHQIAEPAAAAGFQLAPAWKRN